MPHAAAPAVASPAPGEDRLIVHLAIAGNALVALSKFIAAAMPRSQVSVAILGAPRSSVISSSAVRDT